MRKNTYYDGRMIFFLNAENLQPGDIILTRNRRGESNKGRIKSSAIAAAGNSNFSHVLICSQPPTMIEAIGPGVSLLTIVRTFYHEERDVRVLRYRDLEISRRAAAKAGLFLGKGYSVKMAIQSVLRSDVDAEDPMVKTFCSALVSAAYRKGGAPEFRSINPYNTTPGDFMRMDFFKDITMDVSRKRIAPNNIEMMTALDGERRPSPFDGQAKALFMLHAVVADDVDYVFREWKLQLELPTTFFETLEFLVNSIRFANQSVDPGIRELRSALRSIDEKLANEFVKSDLHKMYEDAVRRDSVTLIKQLEKSFTSSPGIDIEATRSLLEATATQIKSRSWIIEDKSRPEGLSLAWDLWRTFSSKSIEQFKHRHALLCEILGRIDPQHRPNK